MPKKLKDWISRGEDYPRWETDFWQSQLMSARVKEDDPGGVCFRLAFKWIACKATGREFKYGWKEHKRGTDEFGDDPVDLAPRKQMKADKVIKHQDSYLSRTKPYEGKGKGYTDFRLNVNIISRNRLNVWGEQKDAKDGGKKYGLKFKDVPVRAGTLSVNSRFDQDVSMLIGIYGDSKEEGPWAHATAFHRRGGEALYFDPNGGEFGFDPVDQVAALIEKDARTRYGEAPYEVKNYVLYVATSA